MKISIANCIVLLCFCFNFVSQSSSLPAELGKFESTKQTVDSESESAEPYEQCETKHMVGKTLAVGTLYSGTFSILGTAIAPGIGTAIGAGLGFLTGTIINAVKTYNSCNHYHV